MSENATATETLVSPPPAPPFYDSFQDAGLKEWAGANKFAGPEDVAKLAHRFDAFKDADPANLRTLPKADDTDAHLALLREIGAPSEAAAYGLDKIENVDKDLANAAQGWFQEAGLLPWQAQKIAAAQMKYITESQNAAANADRVAGENELAQLKTEWAGDYDAKLEMGRRALRTGAQQAGLKGDEIKDFVNLVEQGAGTRAAMKIAAFFGSLIKEGDFVDGKGGASEPNDLAGRWYPNLP